MAQTAKTRAEHPQFIQAIHGIRYQVKDVARSVAFYTQQLGFKLEHQQLPAFASVSLGRHKSCSADPKRPDPGRCPVGNGRSLEVGIAWC